LTTFFLTTFFFRRRCCASSLYLLFYDLPPFEEVLRGGGLSLLGDPASFSGGRSFCPWKERRNKYVILIDDLYYYYESFFVLWLLLSARELGDLFLVEDSFVV